MPLTRQTKLLELSWSSLYYEPVPVRESDLLLMRLIDDVHLGHPDLGSRRIQDELEDMGHHVGRDHVRTLMRKMGIQAVYQKPRLSKPHPGHKIYPYLLRNMEIVRANHVWAADITYRTPSRQYATLHHRRKTHEHVWNAVLLM